MTADRRVSLHARPAGPSLPRDDIALQLIGIQLALVQVALACLVLRGEIRQRACVYARVTRLGAILTG
jgi:hypothetical protein